MLRVTGTLGMVIGVVIALAESLWHNFKGLYVSSPLTPMNLFLGFLVVTVYDCNFFVAFLFVGGLCVEWMGVGVVAVGVVSVLRFSSGVRVVNGALIVVCELISP